MSTRFDSPFLAKILENLRRQQHRRLILLFDSSVDCAVILVTGN